jgi:hypothetical protein
VTRIRICGGRTGASRAPVSAEISKPAGRLSLGRRVVTRPAWLVVIPTAVSGLVWAVHWPIGVRLGYDVKEHISGADLVYLACWYALIACSASAGWRIGRNISPILSLDNASDARVYRIFTWTSAIGVIGMYALVELRSPGLILRSLSTQQFNLVRQQVPQTPGLPTLRYASIVAGAIALHRMLISREYRRVHVINVLLLLANVLVASRLALLMSLLVFIGLTAARGSRGSSHGRWVRWVGLGVLVLAVLTFANYSRNADFYKSRYGISNPLTMMAGESVAYIGSPFQVSVGTTNAAARSYVPASGSSAELNAVVLATPTFFTDENSTTFTHGERWYEGLVSVDQSLTTNSALAALYGLLGLWSIPFMLCVSAAAGFIMGHLSRYRSYMVLGSFVIGYCFAELWRTYLFNEGIVWFLLLGLTGACALAARQRRALR